MDIRVIRIGISLLLLSFIVKATESSVNESLSEDLRQPRVSGRIVKLYSGTRPEPVYCPHEGFQPDPADCAVFYRCVKGANNRYTVFRFQCGPGTVYDPDTEVCNFPKSTKRSECGGNESPSIEKHNENEIEGAQSELPSPISIKPVYGETTSSTENLWAISKLQNIRKPFTAQITAANQGLKPTSSKNQLSRNEGDVCIKDGFMGDSENCRKFYRCVGNQRGGFIRYEFSCSESTVWDEDAQNCNHPWAVQRRRCGRGNSVSGSNSSNAIDGPNKPSQNTIQQQLQVSYGDKVTQTQTQISHAPVIQNQTQINYGDIKHKNKNSYVHQNQTQLSHGSALSQTQTQINHGNNGVQTQLQIDHSKESSQAQSQIYETTSKTTTTIVSTEKDELDQGYGFQPSENQKPIGDDSNNSECSDSGFMGDKNDCKKFYRCVDNGRGSYIKYEFLCGEGTVWDSSIEACNHAWAVKECGEKPTENYPQSTSGNTTTTTTQNHQSTSESIPTEEDTDVGYGNQNQELTSSLTTTTGQPNPTTTNSDSSMGTKCTSSGFMGDPQDCKKFYRCVDNGEGGYTQYEYKCGEGTVWDSQIEVCNHIWAVKKCGGNSSENINKEESTTSPQSTIITTVSLVETTTYTPSQNVDYDSGYGPNQQSESSFTTISTTRHPHNDGASNNKCQTSGFMGDKYDCKKFYRCVDSGNGNYIRYEFTCGEGTVWDSRIEACNHAWAVEKCGEDGSNDIYKETTSSSKPTISDEESGITSVNEKETDRPVQSSSTSAQTTEPIATQKPSSGKECSQEGFMGDSEDCKKFYRCVDNGQGGFIKYEFSCGEGTVWDSEINSCNHANAVNSPCSTSSNQEENHSESTMGSATESTQSLTSEITDESQSTEISEKPSTSKPTNGNKCTREGFMGDKEDCKKFYRCVDNGRGGFIKYEFSCGEGTVWDPEINACNHPLPDGQCGGTSTQGVSTESNHEQDEPITDSGIDSSTSLSSYNTEQSQSTTSTQKPKPSSDNCTSEGFFGDSKDCKKFFRCVDNGKRGYTKYDFTCGDGTIWDQEIQACNHESRNSDCFYSSGSSTQYTDITTESSTSSSTKEQSSTDETQVSPSGSSNKCNSEGFYANQNDCKKFYRCVSDGKEGYTKYDFSCGEGTVWVQEIQACDHDDGETKCKAQGSSSSSTESYDQQSPTSPLSTSSSTSSKEPNQEDDENPNETNNDKPTSSDSDKCTSEGFYPNKNDCKRFYRCVDNGNGGYTKYDFTCGEGTAWDSDIQSCNHINEVKTCQKENQSQNQQQDETSESSGALETTTTTSTSGPATEGTKPSSTGTCEHEGYYGNTQDCTKFYRCVNNGKGGFTKYDFTCGEGTIWDQEITACNHPQDVTNPSCQQSDNSDNSDSSTTSSSSGSSFSSSGSGSTETSSSESSSDSSDCAGTTKKPANKDINCTKDGYYADPNDCKKFYRCVDWDGDGKRFSVYHFECGDGTIWDPALDTCNHEDSVYPPRDCSGGEQSQSENVGGETTSTESNTTEEESMTTEQSTTEQSTTEQETTTQESTTSRQTTTELTTAQQTTSEQTTTEQLSEQTTTQQTTEQTTQYMTEKSTTQEQTTTEQTTEKQTSEHTTEEQTTEHTTQEQTTEWQTSEHTTEEQTTQQSTTDQTTQQTTTTEKTTEEQTTQESTTQNSENTEQTSESDQQSTTQGSTEEISTQESTTQESTDETDSENLTEGTTSVTDSSSTESEQESTTESQQELPTDSGEQTTESSSSEKECPETDDDQNLFVCPTSFRRHPKYCNMFYQCIEDDDTHDVQIASFRCPNNTIYDESKTKCVEEKKADKKCDGEIAQKRRLKRGDTVYKEPIVVNDERLKCPAAGHFPFEKEECSPAFLKCQKTKSGKVRGYVYQCPQNHVYWSVSRRCESKNLLRDCKHSYNNWNGRWEIPIERRNVAP